MLKLLTRPTTEYDCSKDKLGNREESPTRDGSTSKYQLHSVEQIISQVELLGKGIIRCFGRIVFTTRVLPIARIYPLFNYKSILSFADNT